MTITIAVGLIIAAALSTKSLYDATSKNESPASQASTSSTGLDAIQGVSLQTPVPFSAATPEPTSTPAVYDSTLPDGERVHGVMVDGAGYAVYRYRQAYTIGDSQFDRGVAASGRFLVLSVLVDNETNATREISLSQATLADSAGNHYSISAEGQTALALSGNHNAEFLATQIQPHLRRTVALVYDVAPSETSFSLTIPASILGNGQDATTYFKL